MTETKVKKAKVYIDKDGREIPAGYIHKIEKDKHAAAIKLAKRATKLSLELAEFKKELFKVCDELHERALVENQVKLRENSKGSYTISTIDKAVKVEVTVSEFGTFGDDISIAHALIKEFLAEKTKGIVDADLANIISSAFETRGGNLDVKRILSLKKYKIDHPTWRQAMEVIDKSYEVRNTKRYVRIWMKDEHGELQMVPLDFASL
jgi:hypothetical protein